MKKQTHPNHEWTEDEHIYSTFSFFLSELLLYTPVWTVICSLSTMQFSLCATIQKQGSYKLFHYFQQQEQPSPADPKCNKIMWINECS